MTGTLVKFRPLTGSDTMMKNGVTQTISTRHYCITVMKEYNEGKSLEELRLEDYTAGRKCQAQGAQTSTLFGWPSLFGTAGVNTSTATTATPAFGQPPTNQQSFGGFSNPNTNPGLFGTQQNANTSLFGASNPTPAFGQVTKPGGFGFVGSTGTGLFGQAQQPAQQTAPSIFGATNTAAKTSLFENTSGFAGNNTAAGMTGTLVKFRPLTGSDTMYINGLMQTISTRHYCITVMKEYNEGKSLGELRLEDYTAGRKGQAQGAPTSGLFGSPVQPSLFGDAGVDTSTANTRFGGVTTDCGSASSLTASANSFAKQMASFGAPAKTGGAFPFNSNITTSDSFNVDAQAEPTRNTTATPLSSYPNQRQTSNASFDSNTAIAFEDPNQKITTNNTGSTFEEHAGTTGFDTTPYISASPAPAFGNSFRTTPSTPSTSTATSTTGSTLDKPAGTTDFGTPPSVGSEPSSLFETLWAVATTQNTGPSSLNPTRKDSVQPGLSFGFPPSTSMTTNTTESAPNKSAGTTGFGTTPYVSATSAPAFGVGSTSTPLFGTRVGSEPSPFFGTRVGSATTQNTGPSSLNPTRKDSVQPGLSFGFPPSTSITTNTTESTLNKSAGTTGFDTTPYVSASPAPAFRKSFDFTFSTPWTSIATSTTESTLDKPAGTTDFGTPPSVGSEPSSLFETRVGSATTQNTGPSSLNPTRKDSVQPGLSSGFPPSTSITTNTTESAPNKSAGTTGFDTTPYVSASPAPAFGVGSTSTPLFGTRVGSEPSPLFETRVGSATTQNTGPSSLNPTRKDSVQPGLSFGFPPSTSITTNTTESTLNKSAGTTGFDTTPYVSASPAPAFGNSFRTTPSTPSTSIATSTTESTLDKPAGTTDFGTPPSVGSEPSSLFETRVGSATTQNTGPSSLNPTRKDSVQPGLSSGFPPSTSMTTNTTESAPNKSAGTTGFDTTPYVSASPAPAFGNSFRTTPSTPSTSIATSTTGSTLDKPAGTTDFGNPPSVGSEPSSLFETREGSATTQNTGPSSLNPTRKDSVQPGLSSGFPPSTSMTTNTTESAPNKSAGTTGFDTTPYVSASPAPAFGNSFRTTPSTPSTSIATSTTGSTLDKPAGTTDFGNPPSVGSEPSSLFETREGSATTQNTGPSSLNPTRKDSVQPGLSFGFPPSTSITTNTTESTLNKSAGTTGFDTTPYVSASPAPAFGNSFRTTPSTPSTSIATSTTESTLDKPAGTTDFGTPPSVGSEPSSLFETRVGSATTQNTGPSSLNTTRKDSVQPGLSFGFPPSTSMTTNTTESAPNKSAGTTGFDTTPYVSASPAPAFGNSFRTTPSTPSTSIATSTTGSTLDKPAGTTDFGNPPSVGSEPSSLFETREGSATTQNTGPSSLNPTRKDSVQPGLSSGFPPSTSMTTNTTESAPNKSAGTTGFDTTPYVSASPAPAFGNSFRTTPSIPSTSIATSTTGSTLDKPAGTTDFGNPPSVGSEPSSLFETREGSATTQNTGPSSLNPTRKDSVQPGLSFGFPPSTSITTNTTESTLNKSAGTTGFDTTPYVSASPAPAFGNSFRTTPSTPSTSIATSTTESTLDKPAGTTDFGTPPSVGSEPSSLFETRVGSATTQNTGPSSLNPTRKDSVQPGLSSGFPPSTSMTTNTTESAPNKSAGTTGFDTTPYVSASPAPAFGNSFRTTPSTPSTSIATSTTGSTLDKPAGTTDFGTPPSVGSEPSSLFETRVGSATTQNTGPSSLNPTRKDSVQPGLSSGFPPSTSMTTNTTESAPNKSAGTTGFDTTPYVSASPAPAFGNSFRTTPSTPSTSIATSTTGSTLDKPAGTTDFGTPPSVGSEPSSLFETRVGSATTQNTGPSSLNPTRKNSVQPGLSSGFPPSTSLTTNTTESAPNKSAGTTGFDATPYVSASPAPAFGNSFRTTPSTPSTSIATSTTGSTLDKPAGTTDIGTPPSVGSEPSPLFGTRVGSATTQNTGPSSLNTTRKDSVQPGLSFGFPPSTSMTTNTTESAPNKSAGTTGFDTTPYVSASPAPAFGNSFRTTPSTPSTSIATSTTGSTLDKPAGTTDFGTLPSVGSTLTPLFGTRVGSATTQNTGPSSLNTTRKDSVQPGLSFGFPPSTSMTTNTTESAPNKSAGTTGFDTTPYVSASPAPAFGNSFRTTPSTPSTSIATSNTGSTLDKPAGTTDFGTLPSVGSTLTPLFGTRVGSATTQNTGPSSLNTTRKDSVQPGLSFGFPPSTSMTTNTTESAPNESAGTTGFGTTPYVSATSAPAFGVGSTSTPLFGTRVGSGPSPFFGTRVGSATTQNTGPSSLNTTRKDSVQPGLSFGFPPSTSMTTNTTESAPNKSAGTTGFDTTPYVSATPAPAFGVGSTSTPLFGTRVGSEPSPLFGTRVGSATTQNTGPSSLNTTRKDSVQPGLSFGFPPSTSMTTNTTESAPNKSAGTTGFDTTPYVSATPAPAFGVGSTSTPLFGTRVGSEPSPLFGTRVGSATTQNTGPSSLNTTRKDSVQPGLSFGFPPSTSMTTNTTESAPNKSAGTTGFDTTPYVSATPAPAFGVGSTSTPLFGTRVGSEPSPLFGTRVGSATTQNTGPSSLNTTRKDSVQPGLSFGFPPSTSMTTNTTESAPNKSAGTTGFDTTPYVSASPAPAFGNSFRTTPSTPSTSIATSTTGSTLDKPAGTTDFGTPPSVGSEPSPLFGTRVGSATTQNTGPSSLNPTRKDSVQPGLSFGFPPSTSMTTNTTESAPNKSAGTTGFGTTPYVSATSAPAFGVGSTSTPLFGTRVGSEPSPFFGTRVGSEPSPLFGTRVGSATTQNTGPSSLNPTRKDSVQPGLSSGFPPSTSMTTNTTESAPNKSAGTTGFDTTPYVSASPAPAFGNSFRTTPSTPSTSIATSTTGSTLDKPAGTTDIGTPPSVGSEPSPLFGTRVGSATTQNTGPSSLNTTRKDSVQPGLSFGFPPSTSMTTNTTESAPNKSAGTTGFDTTPYVSASPAPAFGNSFRTTPSTPSTSIATSTTGSTLDKPAGTTDFGTLPSVGSTLTPLFGTRVGSATTQNTGPSSLNTTRKDSVQPGLSFGFPPSTSMTTNTTESAPNKSAGTTGFDTTPYVSASPAPAFGNSFRTTPSTPSTSIATSNTGSTLDKPAGTTDFGTLPSVGSTLTPLFGTRVGSATTQNTGPSSLNTTRKDSVQPGLSFGFPPSTSMTTNTTESAPNESAGTTGFGTTPYVSATSAPAFGVGSTSTPLFGTRVGSGPSPFFGTRVGSATTQNTGPSSLNTTRKDSVQPGLSFGFPPSTSMTTNTTESAPNKSAGTTGFDTTPYVSATPAPAFGVGSTSTPLFGTRVGSEPSPLFGTRVGSATTQNTGPSSLNTTRKDSVQPGLSFGFPPSTSMTTNTTESAPNKSAGTTGFDTTPYVSATPAPAFGVGSTSTPLFGTRVGSEPSPLFGTRVGSATTQNTGPSSLNTTRKDSVQPGLSFGFPPSTSMTTNTTESAPNKSAGTTGFDTTPYVSATPAPAFGVGSTSTPLFGTRVGSEPSPLFGTRVGSATTQNTGPSSLNTTRKDSVQPGLSFGFPPSTSMTTNTTESAPNKSAGTTGFDTTPYVSASPAPAFGNSFRTTPSTPSTSIATSTTGSTLDKPAGTTDFGTPPSVGSEPSPLFGTRVGSATTQNTGPSSLNPTRKDSVQPGLSFGFPPSTSMTTNTTESAPNKSAGTTGFGTTPYVSATSAPAFGVGSTSTPLFGTRVGSEPSPFFGTRVGSEPSPLFGTRVGSATTQNTGPSSLNTTRKDSVQPGLSFGFPPSTSMTTNTTESAPNKSAGTTGFDTTPYVSATSAPAFGVGSTSTPLFGTRVGSEPSPFFGTRVGSEPSPLFGTHVGSATTQNTGPSSLNPTRKDSVHPGLSFGFPPLTSITTNTTESTLNKSAGTTGFDTTPYVSASPAPAFGNLFRFAFSTTSTSIATRATGSTLDKPAGTTDFGTPPSVGSTPTPLFGTRVGSATTQNTGPSSLNPTRKGSVQPGLSFGFPPSTSITTNTTESTPNKSAGTTGFDTTPYVSATPAPAFGNSFRFAPSTTSSSIATRATGSTLDKPAGTTDFGTPPSVGSTPTPLFGTRVGSATTQNTGPSSLNPTRKGSVQPGLSFGFPPSTSITTNTTESTLNKSAGTTGFDTTPYVSATPAPAFGNSFRFAPSTTSSSIATSATGSTLDKPAGTTDFGTTPSVGSTPTPLFGTRVGSATTQNTGPSSLNPTRKGSVQPGLSFGFPPSTSITTNTTESTLNKSAGTTGFDTTPYVSATPAPAFGNSFRFAPSTTSSSIATSATGSTLDKPAGTTDFGTTPSVGSTPTPLFGTRVGSATTQNTGPSSLNITRKDSVQPGLSFGFPPSTSITTNTIESAPNKSAGTTGFDTTPCVSATPAPVFENLFRTTPSTSIATSTTESTLDKPAGTTDFGTSPSVGSEPSSLFGTRVGSATTQNTGPSSLDTTRNHPLQLAFAFSSTPSPSLGLEMQNKAEARQTLEADNARTSRQAALEAEIARKDAALAEAQAEIQRQAQLVELERAEAERMRQEAVDSAMCCVCLTQDATHAFLPCGHCCACETCAFLLWDRITGRLGRCPLCRALATQAPIRIWLAHV